MIDFKVDKEKCTHCGLCSSDCPVLIIDRTTEFPTIKDGKEEVCLKCQHCLAVCPEGAISIWGKNPENSIPAPKNPMGSADLEVLIQTRRSIRRYKKQEVDKELIHRLVSIAAYAPTAKNENAVKMTLIDSSERMARLRTLSYQNIGKAFESKAIPPSKMYLNNYREVWESKGVDVLFRNAPHMLICSAPKDGTLPMHDATIATSYFEILANANGIGTLWDGFAKYVFEDAIFEMKDELGIPENQLVVAVLVFGYPAVNFARSIQN